jgi:N-acetylmuramoyl-L-alanine amidase
MIIILDPGHGMSNRRSGVYDPGAVSEGVAEADIALAWANELRGILQGMKHKVVRTRVDKNDPAPVSRRDDIARSYKGDRMLSLHCNAANGRATGSEVYFRGDDDRPMAKALSAVVASVLGIKDRGAKTEADSQHASLAVMEFDKCWLLEIGFIDNPADRMKMLDPALRKKTCEAIAKILTS